MDLFASDLDNTLIYSYKRDIGTDTVCAEVYEGRQVSFMTKQSRELLEKVNQTMHFVPVTTRSVQQYERIRFGDTWSPHLALAANGGVLLRDGVSDPDWYRASCDLIAPAEPALQQAEDVLEHDPNRTLDVRRVDGLFVFTKSADVPHTLARLRDALDLTHVELFENGVKVYVVPRVLNKGTGGRRLLEGAHLVCRPCRCLRLPTRHFAPTRWITPVIPDRRSLPYPRRMASFPTWYSVG